MNAHTRCHRRALAWALPLSLGLALSVGAPCVAQPALKGPEAPYQVQWPTLPEVEAGGVRVVLREPADLTLLLDGAPIPAGWDGSLTIGQALEIPEEGGQVLIVWRDPEAGFVLHQRLEGPGKVTVGPEGRPVIEGLGWVHLFRAVAEALSPYRLTYQEVNTGFESTEVAFTRRRGAPTVLVVEGRVRLGEGEGTRLEAGRWAPAEGDPGRARRSRGDALADAVAAGTKAEVALTPTAGICLTQDAGAHLGGAFVSGVCIPDEGARRAQLAGAREAAYLDKKDVGGALARMGDAYLSGGAFVEAAGSYQKALNAGGVDVGAVGRELGNARWARGDGRGALDAFGLAVAAAPEGAGAWLNLGLAAGALGEEERALKALQEAASLDPSLLEAQLRLGEMHLARGEAKAAVAPLEAAMAGGHGDAYALQGALSRALRESGAHRRAIQVGRARVEGQPDSAEAWFDLARSLLADGKQLEALRAYERALELEMAATRP